MIFQSSQFMPRGHTQGGFLNGACCTRRALSQLRKLPKHPTTVSRTMLQLMLEVCLQLIGLGLRSLDGMTRVFGSGGRRTLNFHSRCGCVAGEVCGCRALECLTCTGATPALPVTRAVWPASLVASLQHSGIT